MNREGGPERLVCEAEVVFPSTAGILAGLELVGFSLWRRPEGEIYVTIPSLAFGAGQEQRFFDYLRPANGGPATTKALKEALVAAYKAQAGSAEPTAEAPGRRPGPRTEARAGTSSYPRIPGCIPPGLSSSRSWTPCGPPRGACSRAPPSSSGKGSSGRSAPAWRAPAGVKVLDGRGLTAIPGLVDEHTHTLRWREDGAAQG